MRELFIYWKVAPEQLPRALTAVRAFQAGLMLNHPALQARLYQRADTSAGSTTLMETYTQPGGLDAAAELEIVQGGDPALAACCQGGRHVERFDRLVP